MLKRIKTSFSPPIFDDYEKTQRALYLNTILWTVFILFTLLEISEVITNGLIIDITKLTLIFILTTTIILQFILKLGYVKAASIILLSIVWFILIVQAGTSAGLYDTALIGSIVIILLSNLLLNLRYSFLFTLLTTIIIWVFAYLQTYGIIQRIPDKAFDIARDYNVMLILIGLISYFTIRSSQKSLEQSSINSLQLAKSNAELQILRASLEKKIDERTLESETRATELAERTKQLELANKKTQKRIAQLQAISEVTRVIAQVRKVNDLLPRITKVISEQFNFYHTGIYLIDEANQYAILSAASSEGGKQLLIQKHRLEVGTSNIIGYVTATGNARIVLDTDNDIVILNNPELPNTHSEVAVALISGNRIIGVLDIQSERTNEFIQDDIDVIQILADQVSIAIENARLFDSTQKSISEAETIYRQYIRNEWSSLTTTENILGFRYTIAGATGLENLIETSEIKKVTQTGQIVTDIDLQSGQAILAVPIKLREEVIGVLNIRTSGKRSWTQEEVGLVQAVAERVAVSAENARLFDQTTSRAERESAVSEITSKIRSTNDPNEMIEIAINELQQILNLKEIRIVPYNPAQQKGMN